MKVKRKVRPWVIIVFILLCLCGVIYYSYEIITWKNDVSENKKIKKEIEGKIEVIDFLSQEKYDIDFNSLKSQNSDAIAYIKVNNTNINYVAVKGTDNSYYLNHNFEKKHNVAGWIFIDYHNNVDGLDKNLIIYGHNTKDGSMFGTLKKILTKDWHTNEDNRKVVLVTEAGTYYYEVFSVYSVVAEDYYINTVFSSDDEFEKFVTTLKGRSIYNYGTEVSGKDKILTLSSCTGGGKKRIVLHAKLLN